MKQQNRINNPADLDLDYIEKEIIANKHVIVQYSDNIFNDNTLSKLNDLCKKYDDSFGVRFYGYYSGSFDFRTLLKIPNVKCLYVDCLTRVDNISILSELNNLTKLSLGVYELKETEILKAENFKNLTELILTETKVKSLNLAHLKDYRNLKFLILGGHTKNIESIGEISNLEYLSLNSIKKTPVDFVNNLKKLKTLKFILGGRENIREIEDNEIENLEIVWVRGFNDISNISKFKKIKYLQIEDNIQLQKVHFDSELPELKDLKILNCKTLNSLTGLEQLKSLHQLRVYKTEIDFNTIISQKLPETLKVFSFYTTKKKIDDAIREQLNKKGYSER